MGEFSFWYAPERRRAWLARDAFDTVGGCWTRACWGVLTGTWLSISAATNVAAEMNGARNVCGIRVELAGTSGEVEWVRAVAIGCIDNFATHAFHGSKVLRAYGDGGDFEKWISIRDRHRADSKAVRWTGTAGLPTMCTVFY